MAKSLERRLFKAYVKHMKAHNGSEFDFVYLGADIGNFIDSVLESLPEEVVHATIQGMIAQRQANAITRSGRKFS